MTRRDALKCVHEPFGDAFYFGPERLSERYENDEKGRVESGFAETTFKTILDRLAKEAAEGKRLFIKDIAHYLVPPNGKPASIAPSLSAPKKGVGTKAVADGTAVNGTATNGTANGNTTGAPYPYHTEAEPGNPTVIPAAELAKFHFVFLIRHPRSSIPSYYRCTVPPLDAFTGFYNFLPSEAGYDELRRLFDYQREQGQIADTNGSGGTGAVDICVVDADDLLDNPAGIIEAFCAKVGLNYDPAMLTWATEEDHEQAVAAFAKWHGFHEDAIDSKSLRPRTHKKKAKSVADEDAEWTTRFGAEGARVVRETVDKNVADYEYLKGFALKAS
ncbi:MAG: hypothetical protein M1832_005413 [Thelocarpon impressellum]|nr:MAG: hypothetical protein M1832_005413 [Thelocarpon impressellum]